MSDQAQQAPGRPSWLPDRLGNVEWNGRATVTADVPHGMNVVDFAEGVPPNARVTLNVGHSTVVKGSDGVPGNAELTLRNSGRQLEVTVHDFQTVIAESRDNGGTLTLAGPTRVELMAAPSWNVKGKPREASEHVAVTVRGNVARRCRVVGDVPMTSLDAPEADNIDLRLPVRDGATIDVAGVLLVPQTLKGVEVSAKSVTCETLRDGCVVNAESVTCTQDLTGSTVREADTVQVDRDVRGGKVFAAKQVTVHRSVGSNSTIEVSHAAEDAPAIVVGPHEIGDIGPTPEPTRDGDAQTPEGLDARTDKLGEVADSTLRAWGGGVIAARAVSNCDVGTDGDLQVRQTLRCRPDEPLRARNVFAGEVVAPKGDEPASAGEVAVNHLTVDGPLRNVAVTASGTVHVAGEAADSNLEVSGWLRIGGDLSAVGIDVEGKATLSGGTGTDAVLAVRGGGSTTADLVALTLGKPDAEQSPTFALDGASVERLTAHHTNHLKRKGDAPVGQIHLARDAHLTVTADMPEGTPAARIDRLSMADGNVHVDAGGAPSALPRDPDSSDRVDPVSGNQMPTVDLHVGDKSTLTLNPDDARFDLHRSGNSLTVTAQAPWLLDLGAVDIDELHLFLVGDVHAVLREPLHRLTATNRHGAAPLLDVAPRATVKTATGTARLGVVRGRLHGPDRSPTLAERLKRARRRTRPTPERLDILEVAEQEAHHGGRVVNANPTTIEYAQIPNLAGIHVFDPDVDAVIDYATPDQENMTDVQKRLQCREHAEVLSAISETLDGKAIPGKSRAVTRWAANRMHHYSLQTGNRLDNGEWYVRHLHRWVGYSQRPLRPFGLWVLAILTATVASSLWGVGADEPSWETLMHAVLQPFRLLRFTTNDADLALFTEAIWSSLVFIVLALPFLFLLIALRNYLRTPNE